jgi:hypothetical protein
MERARSAAKKYAMIVDDPVDEIGNQSSRAAGCPSNRIDNIPNAALFPAK